LAGIECDLFIALSSGTLLCNEFGRWEVKIDCEGVVDIFWVSLLESTQKGMWETT